MLLGILYFLIICFSILSILVFYAPEYIEKEDGTLVPWNAEPE